MKVPVPRAVLLLIFSVPPARLTPAVPVLALAKEADQPCFGNCGGEGHRSIGPTDGEGQIPVPSMFQVCGAVAWTATLMVTAPPLAPTKMPPEVELGARISVSPRVPWLMFTAVVAGVSGH